MQGGRSGAGVPSDKKGAVPGGTEANDRLLLGYQQRLREAGFSSKCVCLIIQAVPVPWACT